MKYRQYRVKEIIVIQQLESCSKRAMFKHNSILRVVNRICDFKQVIC